MEIVVVLLDIRSAYNAGSILRSADCFGVARAVCVGLTPYPLIAGDSRLPHVARTTHQKIIKTSLGAEKRVAITHSPDIAAAISNLRLEGFSVWAVEQNSDSVKLHEFSPAGKIALVFGNEPNGLDQAAIDLTDGCIEIEQFGAKESLNVSVAAGIVLYELTKRR